MFQIVRVFLGTKELKNKFSNVPENQVHTEVVGFHSRVT